MSQRLLSSKVNLCNCLRKTNESSKSKMVLTSFLGSQPDYHNYSIVCFLRYTKHLVLQGEPILNNNLQATASRHC